MTAIIKHTIMIYDLDADGKHPVSITNIWAKNTKIALSLAVAKYGVEVPLNSRIKIIPSYKKTLSIVFQLVDGANRKGYTKSKRITFSARKDIGEYKVEVNELLDKFVQQVCGEASEVDEKVS